MAVSNFRSTSGHIYIAEGRYKFGLIVGPNPAASYRKLCQHMPSKELSDNNGYMGKLHKGTGLFRGRASNTDDAVRQRNLQQTRIQII
jgi:hypothetical protein